MKDYYEKREEIVKEIVRVRKWIATWKANYLTVEGIRKYDRDGAIDYLEDDDKAAYYEIFIQENYLKGMSFILDTFWLEYSELANNMLKKDKDYLKDIEKYDKLEEQAIDNEKEEEW